ncbi:MAG: RagB/SusD family nutrient uptake outer membrane protein, partial [Bacteroidales bacterium]|nr:RagB/SusD family nutrient uptake outer membrane protein [Bacteroidales bacterium]
CKYVISELEDLVEKLPATNEQYRANKYVAAALLSRVCLNAPVYTETTGTDYYDKCIKYSEMVLGGGYSLENDFFKLFNAENYKRTNEIIFSFFTGKDGSNGNKGYGSTTQIICGSANSSTEGGSDNLRDVLGCDGNVWQLFRARKEAAQRFEAGDKRDLFYKDGRSIDNPTPMEEKEASEGYVFNKFCNTNDDGSVASDFSTTLSMVDLPVLRLSEVMLNEAEAILRGGTGASKSALQLINDVRKRAGVAEFSQADIDATTNGVQFWNLLEERGREFMLESLRRTDLIRFNAYAGDAQYTWEWKGGVLSGTSADAKYKFFPLPVAELSANSALYDPYYK